MTFSDELNSVNNAIMCGLTRKVEYFTPLVDILQRKLFAQDYRLNRLESRLETLESDLEVDDDAEDDTADEENDVGNYVDQFGQKFFTYSDNTVASFESPIWNLVTEGANKGLSYSITSVGQVSGSAGGSSGGAGGHLEYVEGGKVSGTNESRIDTGEHQAWNISIFTGPLRNQPIQVSISDEEIQRLIECIDSNPNELIPDGDLT